MTMQSEHVIAALEELRAVLQADGADLEVVTIDPGSDLIELRLDVVHASCAECILPPGDLAATITRAIRRTTPGEFELIVHDPRRTA